MAKLLIFFSALFLCCHVSHAQNPSYSDVPSITQSLRQQMPDSARVLALATLSYAYLSGSLDSAYYFADSSEKLALKINYRRGYYEALIRKAHINSYTGNDSGALRLYHLVLQEAEDTHNDSWIASLKMNIGNIYLDMGDLMEGLINLFQSQYIMEKLNQPSQLAYVLQAIGKANLNYDRYDSAKSYFIKALNYAGSELSPHIYINLGELYANMGEYDSSLSYYRVAMKGVFANGNVIDYAGINLRVSELLTNTGNLDSAITFAHEAMFWFTKTGIPNGQLATSRLLAALYGGADTAGRKKLNSDSAIKYLNLTLQLKDSVFSQDAARKVQVQAFANKQKDAEREQEKRDRQLAEEEEKRKQKNLMQIVGIGAFIPLFFGLVLWLSKIKIKKRLLTFMAALSLLFFFEFITLLLHPVFGEITHHSPFQMFLLLVAVAAILVPIHHKSEKWFMSRLQHKEKIPLPSTVDGPPPPIVVAPQPPVIEPQSSMVVEPLNVEETTKVEETMIVEEITGVGEPLTDKKEVRSEKKEEDKQID